MLFIFQIKTNHKQCKYFCRKSELSLHSGFQFIMRNLQKTWPHSRLRLIYNTRNQNTCSVCAFVKQFKECKQYYIINIQLQCVLVTADCSGYCMFLCTYMQYMSIFVFSPEVVHFLSSEHYFFFYSDCFPPNILLTDPPPPHA